MTQHDERTSRVLDADRLIRDWAATGAHLDSMSRRAIVATLLHEFERPDSPIEGWTEAIYDFDPDLALSVDDARLLRAVLHAHAAATAAVAPEMAVLIQQRGDALVDDLIAASTERHLAVLEETALVDPLTGLHNRRAASQVFDATFAHARRHGRPVAVAVADLVGLKRINDSLGHLAGDDALRRFAESVSANLRAGDSAFRFGGDEFVVVAQDTSGAELRHLFDRLSDDTPEFSVGIAEAPLDGEDAATLLAIADERLYEGRRGETALGARMLNQGEVGLVAFALAALGAMVAEGVRSIAGVTVRGSAVGAWQGVLLGAPIVAAGASAYAGPTDVRSAVRRGSQLAGIGTVAMIAALTPLLSTSEADLVPGTGAPPSDRLTTEVSTEVSAPTTTVATTTTATEPTTTVVPVTSLARTAQAPLTMLVDASIERIHGSGGEPRLTRLRSGRADG